VATAAARRGVPPAAPQDSRKQRNVTPEARAFKLQYAGFMFAWGVLCVVTGSPFLATISFACVVISLAALPM
jgi:hypothetical protein